MQIFLKIDIRSDWLSGSLDIDDAAALKDETLVPASQVSNVLRSGEYRSESAAYRQRILRLITNSVPNESLT